MTNVLPFEHSDESIEETAALFHLCLAGATRCFIFRNRVTSKMQRFAVLHRAQNQYVLYGQGEMSSLFHFECVVLGGLPEAINAAGDLLGEPWELLPT